MEVVTVAREERWKEELLCQQQYSGSNSGGDSDSGSDGNSDDNYGMRAPALLMNKNQP